MTETYVDMLKQELLDRKERSSLYSERAFARDLKVSSGFISLLFNGKRFLSPRTAVRFVESLNWSEIKSQKFMQSVQDSQLVQNASKSKPVHKIEDHELDLDQFRLIANLKHFVILEFIQSREKTNLQDIHKKINIENIELEMILKRLLRLGMISKIKSFYKSSDKNRKLKATPSEAIRNFHKNALLCAQKAVDEQAFEKRELKSLIMSVDPDKVHLFKKKISKFFKEFNEKYGNKKGGEVYQMNVQLFSHFKNKE